jgi:uncharacterized protein (DUF433 family)
MKVIGAFSTEHAARLAGLSKRQLEYWDKTNVFSPSISRDGERRLYGRIYTFQDVVALRTLGKLRACFSLNRLRELGQWLKQHYDHPWSRLRFYVAGSEIAYVDPATQQIVTTKPVRQGAFEFLLEPVVHEVSDALLQMRKRDPEDIGRISRHRYVMGNEWTVKGTRIPVWMIQDMWCSGDSIEAIIGEFPELTPADVQAALAFELPTSRSSAG